MDEGAPRAPRLLFIPVSGRYGMGEYARSLAIAHGAQARWPAANIHFILSRQAPYAASVPFPTLLLDASATFHPREVAQQMRTLRPEVVVFDNAGRTAQLRAARALGARILYISARPRQRRKAFRWRWMRCIDMHLIAYPSFLAGPLSALERLKLKFIGAPQVRFLDVILPRADSARRTAVLERAGCAPGAYVLLVPGGGTGHPGVTGAAAQFLRAGEMLAAAGTEVLYVGARDGEAPSGAVRCLPLVELADLGELMRAARLIIANGGSTLLQAIACEVPVIAVPIAADQAPRARRCAAAGVAVQVALDASAIATASRDLLADAQARAALVERARALRLADGIDVAVDAIAHLLTPNACTER